MRSATIIAVLVVYLTVLIAIGLWGSRESKSVAGYYVAGKKLPWWVIAFSSNATGESGWLLLGLTGMGYLVGIHALWVVLGEVLGVTLAWVFVARPFKEYTDRFQAITVPDYLESRFQDTRHILRLIGAGIILTMVAAYTAAQLTASGKAFDSFLGTGYVGGVLLGAVVILFYTTIGGFKAVAYNDVLNGALMFGALLLVPCIGLIAAGGWTSVMTALRAQDLSLVQPMGQFGLSLPGIVSALGFVGIGLAFLGSPQLLTRFMSARNLHEIYNGGLTAVICIIVFDIGAVFTGLAGRVLYPGLADPETILPTMSAGLLPSIFTGVVLVVVLAAIISTVDSLLILASSAVLRDVVQKVFQPAVSEARLSLYGKLITLVIGIAAVGLALGQIRVIFWFVLFAWSGLATAFTPVILCSLFWKRTTLAGAIAGMTGGFAATVIWVVLFKSQFHNLYEMIPGFVVGLALTVGVSAATRAPHRAAEQHEAVHRSVGLPFQRQLGGLAAEEAFRTESSTA